MPPLPGPLAKLGHLRLHLESRESQLTRDDLDCALAYRVAVLQQQAAVRVARRSVLRTDLSVGLARQEPARLDGLAVEELVG